MSNIVVLFEVTPTEAGRQKYLDLAAMLKPLLSGYEGFIRAERFASLGTEGKLLSLNEWTSEEAVERWRNEMKHRASQKKAAKRFSKATESLCARSSAATQTSSEPKRLPTQMNFSKPRPRHTKTKMHRQSQKASLPH